MGTGPGSTAGQGARQLGSTFERHPASVGAGGAELGGMRRHRAAPRRVWLRAGASASALALAGPSPAASWASRAPAARNRCVSTTWPRRLQRMDLRGGAAEPSPPGPVVQTRRRLAAAADAPERAAAARRHPAVTRHRSGPARRFCSSACRAAASNDTASGAWRLGPLSPTPPDGARDQRGSRISPMTASAWRAAPAGCDRCRRRRAPGWSAARCRRRSRDRATSEVPVNPVAERSGRHPRSARRRRPHRVPGKGAELPESPALRDQRRSDVGGERADPAVEHLEHVARESAHRRRRSKQASVTGDAAERRGVLVAHLAHEQPLPPTDRRSVGAIRDRQRFGGRNCSSAGGHLRPHRVEPLLERYAASQHDAKGG